MKAAGIQCVFHYLPLHTSGMARKIEYAGPPCPVTESVSSRIVRLPFFTSLDVVAQARVIAAATAYRPLTQFVKGPL
jgi:dTDP-4-amino-4,6-dideoxygalactose transaminase